MLINLKLLKVVVIITFLINPYVVLGNDIEKFANKLFNHYEYDDKINIGIFILILFSLLILSSIKSIEAAAL